MSFEVLIHTLYYCHLVLSSHEMMKYVSTSVNFLHKVGLDSQIQATEILEKTTTMQQRPDSECLTIHVNIQNVNTHHKIRMPIDPD